MAQGEDEGPRTCVVLGGRGFLGRSLVLKLLSLGKWIVRVADSTHSLTLDPSESDSLLSQALSSRRASSHAVDLRRYSQIIQAIEGSSVVFYFDGAESCTSDFYHSYMLIVQGAKNVISACHECKVQQLIYNSSADVVFDGLHDILAGDESFTYPSRFGDMLSDLKAQAESLVLHSNNVDGLLTCALRPSNVFGPGDPLLVPFLVNLAKSSWAKIIIGSGDTTSDFTYADNVIHAHICAQEALDCQTVSAAGKAFFITNLEPMNFWKFVTHILEGLGYQRPVVKVPSKIVRYILLFIKWITEEFGLTKYNHSLSARYVQLASCTKTFVCTAAQNCIGYSPIVSLEEGVTSTIGSFSHLAKYSSLTSCSDFNEQSKAEKLLGSAELANILLWRDEKKSFIYFLALSLLFYCFYGRTFATAISKLLLLVAIILYGYGILPSKLFGFNRKGLSASCFEIHKMVVKDEIARIAYVWNQGICYMRLLARGDDWDIFFKVAASLYCLKLILSQALTVVTAVVLVLAFTVFFVYEQYESEIDGLAKLLFNTTTSVFGLLRRNLPASAQSYPGNYEILHPERGRVSMKHHT